MTGMSQMDAAAAIIAVDTEWRTHYAHAARATPNTTGGVDVEADAHFATPHDARLFAAHILAAARTAELTTAHAATEAQTRTPTPEPDAQAQTPTPEHAIALD